MCSPLLVQQTYAGAADACQAQMQDSLHHTKQGQSMTASATLMDELLPLSTPMSMPADVQDTASETHEIHPSPDKSQIPHADSVGTGCRAYSRLASHFHGSSVHIHKAAEAQGLHLSNEEEDASHEQDVPLDLTATSESLPSKPDSIADGMLGSAQANPLASDKYAEAALEVDQARVQNP